MILREYTSEIFSIVIALLAIASLIVYGIIFTVKLSLHKIKYNRIVKGYIYIIAVVVSMEFVTLATDFFKSEIGWLVILKTFHLRQVQYWIIPLLNLILIKHLKISFK